jgi:hypothetical protein
MFAPEDIASMLRRWEIFFHSLDCALYGSDTNCWKQIKYVANLTEKTDCKEEEEDKIERVSAAKSLINLLFSLPFNHKYKSCLYSLTYTKLSA